MKANKNNTLKTHCQTTRYGACTYLIHTFGPQTSWALENHLMLLGWSEKEAHEHIWTSIEMGVYSLDKKTSLVSWATV